MIFLDVELVGSNFPFLPGLDGGDMEVRICVAAEDGFLEAPVNEHVVNATFGSRRVVPSDGVVAMELRESGGGNDFVLLDKVDAQN